MSELLRLFTGGGNTNPNMSPVTPGGGIPNLGGIDMGMLNKYIQQQMGPSTLMGGKTGSVLGQDYGLANIAEIAGTTAGILALPGQFEMADLQIGLAENQLDRGEQALAQAEADYEFGQKRRGAALANRGLA